MIGLIRGLLLALLGGLMMRLVRRLLAAQSPPPPAAKDTTPHLDAKACPTCGSYSTTRCERSDCVL
jgi:hypothetical protein